MTRFEEQAQIRERLKELRKEQDALHARLRELEMTACTKDQLRVGRIVYLRRGMSRYGIPKGAKGKVIKMRRQYCLVTLPGYHRRYSNFLVWPDDLSFDKP